ncbi:hypothetical protein [Methylocystis sp.]
MNCNVRSVCQPHHRAERAQENLDWWYAHGWMVGADARVED